MQRERVGLLGEGRPGAFRLRLVLAWLLGALLAGPLGAATPAVAAPRAVPTPVHVAKASAGAGHAAGRLTHRGAQTTSAHGRTALVTAVEGLWSVQDAPQRPGAAGVPATGPSLGGLVPAVVPTLTPAGVAPSSAPAAVRGRAPPGVGTSATAGPFFPLPA